MTSEDPQNHGGVPGRAADGCGDASSVQLLGARSQRSACSAPGDDEFLGSWVDLGRATEPHALCALLRESLSGTLADQTALELSG
jgi:hypothetical protein